MTLNLKLRDIDAATEAKHRLEEKQRAEARERKEKEMQWETRVSFLPVTQCIVTCCLRFDASVISSIWKCLTYDCFPSLQLFHEDGECWVYDEPLLKRMASLRH